MSGWTPRLHPTGGKMGPGGGTQAMSTQFSTATGMDEESSLQVERMGALLARQLGPEYLSTRSGGGGAKLTYVEGWRIINLANEVFGFNGWSTEVKSLELDFIDYDEESKRWTAGCTALVRVTLAHGSYHEDVGYGKMDNCKSKGDAIDKIKKEAVTDATKRALRYFGNLLGNCAYDKTFLENITKVAKKGKPSFNVGELHRPDKEWPDPPAYNARRGSTLKNETFASQTPAGEGNDEPEAGPSSRPMLATSLSKQPIAPATRPGGQQQNGNAARPQGGQQAHPSANTNRNTTVSNAPRPNNAPQAGRAPQANPANNNVQRAAPPKVAPAPHAPIHRSALAAEGSDEFSGMFDGDDEDDLSPAPEEGGLGEVLDESFLAEGGVADDSGFVDAVPMEMNGHMEKQVKMETPGPSEHTRGALPQHRSSGSGGQARGVVAMPIGAPRPGPTYAAAGPTKRSIDAVETSDDNASRGVNIQQQMSANLGISRQIGAGAAGTAGKGKSPAERAREARLAEEQALREKENQPQQQQARTGGVQMTDAARADMIAANRAIAMAKREQAKRLKVSQEGATAAGAA